jgi:SAM-dependent methyltransferase
MTRAAQASSFGTVARKYAAVRPGYPVRAVRWGLPPGAEDVLDLGAGTGQVSSVLVTEGLTVSAVEPDPRMLAELRRDVPAARAYLGRAEQIPLPAGSVDAVLVGHAFHWFGSEALAEMARVLRPGGTVALMWNLRDDAVDWVAKLSGLIALGAQDSTSFESPVPFSDRRFSRMVRRTFPYRQHMTREGLLALVGTRGYVLTLPDSQRYALLADVAHLMDTHPQLAGRTEFDLPYVTEVWRAQRRDGDHDA